MYFNIFSLYFILFCDILVKVINIMKDYVLKAFLFDKNVRIYAASSTNLVEEARKLHGMWPTSSAALGRFLTIAAMMSLRYKSNEHLTIKIDGQGPIGEMLVEASNGVVKGSIHNPEVFMQYNDGHLAVGKAVGNDGYITVTKDLHMSKPFTSFSPLQTGEIGDDFTYYFLTSEQIPSSIGAGVLVNPDNSIKAAGGFIIELLPSCPEEVISKLENILKNLKPISQMIDEGYTPLDIIKEIANDDYEILEEKDIKYHCDCSKERFRRGLKVIGKDELLDIINTDQKAEILCHFCMKKYIFTKEELEEIVDEMK